MVLSNISGPVPALVKQVAKPNLILCVQEGIIITLIIAFNTVS